MTQSTEGILYVDFGAGCFVSEKYATDPDEQRYYLDDATHRMTPVPKEEDN
jgi:hypothetical protein